MSEFFRIQPPLSLGAWQRLFVVSKLLEGISSGSMLEIGMGAGSISARLASRFGRYVGLEQDFQSFSAARPRLEKAGGETVHSDIASFEPSETFDVIGAFEVLEHIEHDDKAVREWKRFLEPGGWILLTVPAHPDKFGPHDQKAGHFRRYTRTSLNQLLVQAGFSEITLLSYGFPAGYLLEFFRHKLAKRTENSLSIDERTKQSGRWLQPPQWTSWLMALIGVPLALVQGPFVHQDWGIGLAARARLER